MNGFSLYPYNVNLESEGEVRGAYSWKGCNALQRRLVSLSFNHKAIKMADSHG